jgi:hypothetical protein
VERPLPSAPGPPVEKPSLRDEWPYAAGLVIFFVGAAIAVGAYRDVPVMDDWAYAWSVERLLHRGRLEVLDWSAVYPVGPALWGAAWSLVLGFSFATLRLSTLVLALVASGALYLILRELETPPRLALFGALSMAANPVFLLLSSSFMTDVPFVAFTLLALLCYVRAMRRDDPALLWWGGVWACVSCLDRQIGVLTPIAALPLLVRPPIGRISRSATAFSLVATWLVMLVGSVVITSWLQPTGEMTKLVDRLAWLLEVPVASYVRSNLYILSTVAFYALPALLAMATVRGVWRTRTLVLVVASIAAIMLGFLGEIPVPLRPESTWTLTEVGGTRLLISGLVPAVEAPWIENLLRGAGLLAAALALLAVMKRDRVPPLVPRGASPHAHGPAALVRRALHAVKEIPLTTRAPLVVYLVAYLLLVNVLWFYNDRYLLVLLPVIVALALSHRAARPGVPRLAWVMSAIFAVVAITGTRDALRFNQAVRDSWQALVDSGVRPSDIDAGYAWTGWMLYAHPENLANGLTVGDVPWITSKRRLPYLISKTRIDGYDVAREVAWSDDASWPGPDRLFVLKRRAPSPTGGARSSKPSG